MICSLIDLQFSSALQINKVRQINPVQIDSLNILIIIIKSESINFEIHAISYSKQIVESFLTDYLSNHLLR